MGENKWSDEQLDVLKSRNENLLVSAAAGAGKTTVLVERILRLVTEPGSDIDIDRLLIMTFTNAAAAEMRERIADTLDRRLEDEPDNDRLIRQQMLVHNASIMTIDSFCLSVVREFFHAIDLDPAFRIGEEAELKLLSDEIMDETLEDAYLSDERFMGFAERFCGTSDDAGAVSLIGKLALCADSHPWPERWLDEVKKSLRPEAGELEELEWVKFIDSYVTDVLTTALGSVREAAKLAALPGVPAGYASVIATDETLIEGIIKAKGLNARHDAVFTVKFPNKPRASKDEDEYLTGRICALREAYKETVKGLKAGVLEDTLEEIMESLNETAEPMEVLIERTRDYLRRFKAAKKERNLVDFSDLEHYTLDILARCDEDGHVHPTREAIELKSRFAEIFVDEYQDSNFVQEQITMALAGADGARPNTFMVGDVKQSIYKFRMAKPELFLDRAARYSRGEGGRNIVLGKNYRSRAEVLESTNDVFYMTMQPSIGGILYDDEAALKVGRSEPEPDGRDYRTQVVLALPGEEKASDEASDDTEVICEETPDDEGVAQGKVPKLGVAKRRVLEARAAVTLIREMFDTGMLIEQKDGTKRPLTYADIVILFRSVRGSVDAYRDEFEKAGIPFFTEISAGYLGSYEIRTMLDFLRIVDNPEQDIPLAAVLHSPIGGFSADDLACIRICGTVDETLYDSLLAYETSGPDHDLRGRVHGFLQMLSEISGMDRGRDIDRLISAIFGKTGFYNYCKALPGGDLRSANLDRLLDYALEYESGSYAGLFSFVRYISRIAQADQDLEEAAGAEAVNAVRMMTIHKSKGLEFPIVILAGMSKELMCIDARGSVLMSSDFGISCTNIDPVLRTSRETTARKTMALRMKLDYIGEELRLLYVAMTRAKQQLILLGSEDPAKLAVQEEKWEQRAMASGPCPYGYISEAKSYFDFAMPAAYRHTEHFIIRKLFEGDIRTAEENHAAAIEARRRAFVDMVGEPMTEEESEQALILRKLIDSDDGQDRSRSLPIKLSVSDIKKQSMLEEYGYNVYETLAGEAADETKECFPAGDGVEETKKDASDQHRSKASSEKTPRPAVSGADRGTLYHKVMQFIPFTETDAAGVGAFLDSLVLRDIISKDEQTLLRTDRIAAFLKSALCREMEEADAQGALRREQPFVIGRRACDIRPEYEGITDTIPIQGVIDCIYETEKGLVIVDYKTDRVDSEEDLLKRYKAQLEYYAQAAEQLIGRPVVRKVMWSFALGREVDV